MRLRQIWLAATGVTALVGVSLSFIGSGSLSAHFGVWNTLAFWTIQSNLLVGITSVLLSFRMDSRSVVLRVAYLTSLIAITFTFLVAHTTLETPFTTPGGSIRHDVAPVMAVVGWLVLGPRNIFEWRFIPIPWLYGILYDGVTLIRGAMIDWYPYVFLDPRPHGYAELFKTIAAATPRYLLITAIFVGVDRWSQRRKRIVRPAGV